MSVHMPLIKSLTPLQSRDLALPDSRPDSTDNVFSPDGHKASFVIEHSSLMRRNPLLRGLAIQSGP